MLIPNYSGVIQRALPKSPTAADLCDALKEQVAKQSRGLPQDDALLRAAYAGKTDEDAYAKLLLEIGYRACANDIIAALGKGAIRE